MRYLNVRQFIRNHKEEVLDLPFTVTRYGKPVFVVSDPKEYEADKGFVELVTNPTATQESVKGTGFSCQMPFCHEKAIKDVNGKWFCEEHL